MSKLEILKYHISQMRPQNEHCIYSPQRAAQRISELNLFLYLRISGVSEPTSCEVGVTFTLTCDSRRVGPEPPAPNPNVRNERCFCWRGWGGDLDTAWRYCNPRSYSSIYINGGRKKKTVFIHIMTNLSSFNNRKINNIPYLHSTAFKNLKQWNPNFKAFNHLPFM
jgi:hypothetical protein